jgi:hypothetical protein
MALIVEVVGSWLAAAAAASSSAAAASGDAITCGWKQTEFRASSSRGKCLTRVAICPAAAWKSCPREVAVEGATSFAAAARGDGVATLQLNTHRGA